MPFVARCDCYHGEVVGIISRESCKLICLEAIVVRNNLELVLNGAPLSHLISSGAYAQHRRTA